MEWLAIRLLEVGPVVSELGGWNKVPWSEFLAWKEVTETPLTVWEIQSLILASTGYAAAMSEHYEKSTNAPFNRDLTDAEIEVESVRADEQIEAQFDKAWVG